MTIGIINASAEKYGDLTYSISNGEVTITDCTFTVTSVEIPSEIDGIPVTSVENSAFKGCSILTSITIPDSVKIIENFAFYRCSSLGNVYYNGTADMWKNINIGGYNDELENAERIYVAFITDIEKTDKGYSFDITLNKDVIDSFETATLTVGIYDDNKMLLDLVRVSVTSETTISPIVETNRIPDYAKIMLWGGENIFNPLCIPKEIPIE